MSAGPIAVTWYGGARYAELTSTDPPMSTIAVAARHPLAVDRHALGAREPQLLDDREHVLPRDEVVAPVAALGHRPPTSP